MWPLRSPDRDFGADRATRTRPGLHTAFRIWSAAVARQRVGSVVRGVESRPRRAAPPPLAAGAKSARNTTSRFYARCGGATRRYRGIATDLVLVRAASATRPPRRRSGVVRRGRTLALPTLIARGLRPREQCEGCRASHDHASRRWTVDRHRADAARAIRSIAPRARRGVRAAILLVGTCGRRRSCGLVPRAASPR